MNDSIIIIPAYNESDSLSSLMHNISSISGSWDALVINDCSNDGSKAILNDLGVSHLNLPINLGIGGAMHAGYRWAWEHGYDYALQLDGDGQHPPEEIEKLSRKMKETHADMVIGSRFLKESEYHPGHLRKRGIKIFQLISRLFGGRRIHDPTSGFRLVNRKVLKLFASDYPSDYPEVITLIEVLMREYRVEEVQVTMKKREHGKTSIGPWLSLYYMIKVPFSILLKYRLIRKEK